MQIYPQSPNSFNYHMFSTPYSLFVITLPMSIHMINSILSPPILVHQPNIYVIHQPLRITPSMVRQQAVEKPRLRLIVRTMIAIKVQAKTKCSITIIIVKRRITIVLMPRPATIPPPLIHHHLQCNNSPMVLTTRLSEIYQHPPLPHTCHIIYIQPLQHNSWPPWPCNSSIINSNKTVATPHPHPIY